MKATDIALRKTMCLTCPFRAKSPYAYLADDLTESAITQASRICHSTGSDNAINDHTGLAEHLCRGARDIQLKTMTAMGVIKEPTDTAWNDVRVKIGMQPTVVKNPRCLKPKSPSQ